MKPLRFPVESLSWVFFLLLLLNLPAASRAQESGEEAPEIEGLVLLTDSVRPSPKEARSLLAGICGPADVQKIDEGSLYCGKVPGYPNEYLGSGCSRLRIRKVTYGHFTAPDAVEVVADYQGCEPHALLYGGSVLLRKEAGSWRRIKFLPGERSTWCLTFPRRDGRDALVCVGTQSMMGEEDAWVDLLFPAWAGKNPEMLVNFENNQAGVYCEYHRAGQRQSHSALKSWERQPASAGAPARLVLHVETQSFITPKFCAAWPDDTAAMDAQADRFEAFRKGLWHSKTLVFDWTGEKFVRR